VNHTARDFRGKIDVVKRTWVAAVMAVTLGCGAANTEQASIPPREGVSEPHVDTADAAVTIEAKANQPDAGPPSPEPTRDLEATWGGNADDTVLGTNVTLIVNFVEVRKHPDADKLAAVLNATPQWRIAPGALEPVRDLDWVRVTGPTLVTTDLDDVVFQHSALDEKVDNAITHELKGQRLALQVRGVKAWTATIGKGQRAILHAPPHLVAIIARVDADSVARQMTGASPAHTIASPVFHPGEAMRLRALHPGTAMP
jgi:hypothetical protein